MVRAAIPVVLCVALVLLLPSSVAALAPHEELADALRGLVKEYGEYVADGVVADQQGYDANVIGAYLPYLHAAWNETRPLVAQRDAAEADHMGLDVARLDTRVRELAPNAEVESLAQDLANDVARFFGDQAAPSPAGAMDALQATEKRVHEAVQAYARGERDQALSLLSSAYLQIYAPGAEAAVPRDLNARIEQLMNIALRDQMQRGAPLAEVQATERALHEAFATASSAVATPVSGAGMFANSFLIIAREGFEAALVLAAVVGYLVRSGHKDKARQVYAGAGLGIAVSLALFALVSTVFIFSGESRELLGGVTTLLAVAVLFYVSYWLIDKVQIRRWNRFIQGKVRSALTGGKAYALVSVAFLAVFREGLETVLFYQALLGSAPTATAGASALAGFVLGFGVLAAVFYGFTRWGVAIPMRPFFILTSAMLYYLAFAFAGAGVHELQEAGVVGVTALPALQDVLDGSPLAAGLAGLLGVHATLETLLAQAVLLVAAVAGLVYSFVILPRREPAVPVGNVEV